MPKQKTEKIVNFEQQLFKTADKLRKNIDAAEYKHVVLGLIFLKYISDSFEDRRAEIRRDFEDPKSEWYVEDEKERAEAIEDELEERDLYKEKNVFWVPMKARWSYLQSEAKQLDIGNKLDEAMELIEKENDTLKNILPKVFARPNLDKKNLGELIDLVSDIALGTEAAKSKDVLGRVYEYFLGEFANAEGKKGGQFYTPKAIVKLMVEMIEPYKGRVFDPACGSGGMFVMSEKFLKEHQGNIDDISIYGQESNQTTYRLCRMNLAIRGIDGSQVKWNSEGSFLKDAHLDLKADYVLANPPFNQSDWGQEILAEDPRWQYGVPPSGNANYAWLQHMIYHLAPHGIMSTVLANGSLSSNTSGEGEIRKNLIEADLVDCIVALPKQLFYNTGIPACLWFLSRKRSGNGDRKRSGEILFIDASEMGFMQDRTHRAFTDEDIQKITKTYHEWRAKENQYKDVKGFCKSASLAEIQKNNFVLTPGCYVGIKDELDDGIKFEDKMQVLTTQLAEQMAKEAELNEEIKRQLGKVGFEL